jgi:hypothetical protein
MDTIRCILTRKLYYPKKIQVPSRKKYTVREFVEFVWFFESQSQRVPGRFRRATVSWQEPAAALQRALRLLSPPLSGAAPNHRRVRAAPWLPSCRRVRAAPRPPSCRRVRAAPRPPILFLMGTTSVFPAESPSTSPARRRWSDEGCDQEKITLKTLQLK